MMSKTYLAKLIVAIGEYENSVTLLIVANSNTQADEVLEEAASMYYGDGEAKKEDGGYYANGGELHVRAGGAHEIGVSTFLELKKHYGVRRADNVQEPSLEGTSEGAQLKAAATNVARALKARKVEVGSSVVLEAIAAAMGFVNWQTLQARLKAAPSDGKHPDCLVVFPSTDGPTWDLYATAPRDSVQSILTMFSAWLEGKKAEDLELEEGDAYNAEDVERKLRELGCKTFSAIEKGTQWD